MSGSNRYQRENKLLILCTRPDVSGELIQVAAGLLAEEIDWGYLARVALAHQVIPLVNRTLQQLGEPTVPGDILYALNHRVEAQLRYSESVIEQWPDSSHKLAAAGVQAPIVIQGPPLSESATGDSFLNPSGSLAILALDSDRALIHERLLSLGFCRQKDNDDVLAVNPSILATNTSYQRPKDHHVLNLLSTRSVDNSPATGLYEALRRLSSAPHYRQQGVLYPPPNGHFIALCVKAAIEQWLNLGTLADIAQVAYGQNGFDPEQVLLGSKHLGLEQVAALGLALASRLVPIKTVVLPSSAESADAIEKKADDIWRQLALKDLGKLAPQTVPTAATGTTGASGGEFWKRRSDAWERWSDLALVSMADLTESLFQAAGIEPQHRVLDLACGTGDTSLLLSPRVGPAGSVIATDLVAEMVESGRQRARRAKLRNIEWAVADMEHLPFADRAFDAVLSRLGIMYCPSVESALCESHRVLRPGGRAAFLVCGPMENNDILAVVHEVLWDLFDIRPEKPAAPFRFAQKNSLSTKLEKAGFIQVEELELRSTKTLPLNAILWQPAAERAIGMGLDSLPPLTRTELERRMDAALQPCLQGDRFELSSHSRIGLGTRPAWTRT